MSLEQSNSKCSYAATPTNSIVFFRVFLCVLCGERISRSEREMEFKQATENSQITEKDLKRIY